MRWRVDTLFGWASFDEADWEKARQMYDESGIRLRRCEDLGDEGVVVAGLPLGVDPPKPGALAN